MVVTIRRITKKVKKLLLLRKIQEKTRGKFYFSPETLLYSSSSPTIWSYYIYSKHIFKKMQKKATWNSTHFVVFALQIGQKSKRKQISICTNNHIPRCPQVPAVLPGAGEALGHSKPTLQMPQEFLSQSQGHLGPPHLL